MKLLELFSGTGSVGRSAREFGFSGTDGVGRVAREFGFSVISLDLKNTNINEDTLQWDSTINSMTQTLT